MIAIDFQPVKKEHKAILDKYFRAGRYENSHDNFTTVYIWRKMFHIHWAVEDDVLFLTSKWNGRMAVMQPFGPESKLKAAVRKQAEWMASIGQPFFAHGVERDMVKHYESLKGRELVAFAERDDSDYLYLTDDLIKLSGRKYHTKKNHLNSFWRSYPEAEYVPITDDIVPACKLNMNMWYKAQEKDSPGDPFLATERAGVMDILSDFSYFGLTGGALALGKRIVAFTIGERTRDDTVVIHIEKAAPDVRDAYAAINQAFLENEWADVKYVNRQEDMGLDGLRQAKEAYRPIRMIEKFTIMPR